MRNKRFNGLFRVAVLHARLSVLTATEFGDWRRVRLGTGAALASEQGNPRGGSSGRAGNPFLLC